MSEQIPPDHEPDQEVPDHTAEQSLRDAVWVGENGGRAMAIGRESDGEYIVADDPKWAVSLEGSR